MATIGNGRRFFTIYANVLRLNPDIALRPDKSGFKTGVQGLPLLSSIDIPPRWGGIHAAVKIGIGGCKSSIVSFAPDEVSENNSVILYFPQAR